VVAEEVALMWGSFLQSVIDFFIIGLAIFVALRAMAAFKAEVDRRGRRLFARKMAKETVGQEEANKRRY
jgi:large-conductance mechanosensitive channel